jgi:hypothetical protein
MSGVPDYVRPRGDITTVLDQADRDTQDDFLFPIDSNISWFSAPINRRTINFTPQIQSFVHKGPAQWGGRFTFEIDKVSAGDLIHMVALRVRLGHWLDVQTLADLSNNTLIYQNPTADAWTYANAIGRVLVESAEIQVDDTVLETVDTVAADIILKLYPDLNNIFGYARDYQSLSQPLLPPQIKNPQECLTHDVPLQQKMARFSASSHSSSHGTPTGPASHS